MPFDLKDALGLQVDPQHFGEILIHLAVALFLGALLAYRPWRRMMRHAPKVAIEQAHAQTLIAVSGAVMVAVIGDNIARAFGLVGLGGFIRFRSGIKDPRDAAVMFVMIGVGMACGLGAIPIAIVTTTFVGAILIVFDATGAVRAKAVRVVIAVADPRSALPTIRGVFPEARVVGAANTNPEPGKIVLEMRLGEGVDAATILKDLESKGVTGVRDVSLSDD